LKLRFNREEKYNDDDDDDDNNNNNNSDVNKSGSDTIDYSVPFCLGCLKRSSK